MDIIEQLRATPETGADPDMIFEAADEIERLRNGFCGAQTLQFLSDVVTAAGLLRHGKTDKGLADRINDGAQRLRIIAVTPNARGNAPDTARTEGPEAK